MIGTTHRTLANRTSALLTIVLTIGVPAGTVTAQVREASATSETALERDYPEVHALLVRVERAQGALFGALASAGLSAPSGDRGPSSFESNLVVRLTESVSDRGASEALTDESRAGYAALGDRAAEIIARGHAFYRAALGILVDPDVPDRRAALRDAVARYRSRPEVALPAGPKDMDILYDHPHALAFRTGYPDLAGFVWSGHWLRLAATEPLTDFPSGVERAAGLDTVTTRYYAKLSGGEPPQSYPSQIPLAPAIAPGLIFMSPESAMIRDNLTMMLEVFADILASPTVSDVQAALELAVDQFLDPEYRMSARGSWESMALQHGIFFQGGFPLDPMTRSELNGDPHAAHRGAAGGPIVMPGGPG